MSAFWGYAEPALAVLGIAAIIALGFFLYLAHQWNKED